MDSGILEVIGVAKVQTVEEQAEVRDSLKAVWCKGNQDACNSGTDNGDSSTTVRCKRGKESSKGGTGGRKTDSSMAERWQ